METDRCYQNRQEKCYLKPFQRVFTREPDSELPKLENKVVDSQSEEIKRYYQEINEIENR